MATKDPSSSTTLRFLAVLNPPDFRDPIRPGSDPVELHESDVVWSFSLSSPANPPSISPSFPHHQHQHQHQHRRFSPTKSGLSAALSDEDDRLVRKKSSVNPKDDAGVERQYHHHQQSAPVNIPLWPKELREKFRSSGDLMSFDDVHGCDGSAAVDEDEDEDEDGEMVPPHVIVARSHVTFSVFEGQGRTLKGRDLRRVRNAVLQQTGLID